MWSHLVRIFISTIGRCATQLGRDIKRLLRPSRTAVTLVGAAGLDAVRPRSCLVAENALLGQQILALKRAGPGRPRLHREDRLILVILARLHTGWRDILLLVKPDTLLRWHRDLFTLVCRRRSRPKRQGRPLRAEVIELIQTMATANRLWGAERVRGELLKLGIRVSKRTIQKYMRAVRPRQPPGQTWTTFLRNHASEIWACDFLQLYDAWFRPVFAFVIITHACREVVHVNVTRFPHRCLGGPAAARGDAVRPGSAILDSRQRR